MLTYTCMCVCRCLIGLTHQDAFGVNKDDGRMVRMMACRVTKEEG
jgi:hypothetical protein